MQHCFLGLGSCAKFERELLCVRERLGVTKGFVGEETFEDN